MTLGLAGTGSEKDWQVDIDEAIGRGLYGVTITSRQYRFQVAGLQFERLVLLRGFLSTSERQERFRLLDVFGGKLEFVRDEGRLALRITQVAGELGTNLVALMLQPAEWAALGLALERAIQDVQQR